MWSGKWFASVLLALGVLVTLSVAQKDASPRYDVKTEVTFKATVEEVKEVAHSKGHTGIHLMVKADNEVREVRLCPINYLKEFEITFKKGDQLTITASKVQVEGKDVFLAREIEAGNNKIVLRDKEGAPVWTWLIKGGDK